MDRNYSRDSIDSVYLCACLKRTRLRRACLASRLRASSGDLSANVAANFLSLNAGFVAILTLDVHSHRPVNFVFQTTVTARLTSLLKKRNQLQRPRRVVTRKQEHRLRDSNHLVGCGITLRHF